MKIIIESELTTSKENFFAYPFRTFRGQTLPTKYFLIPLQQRSYDWPKSDSIDELLSDLDQHLLQLNTLPLIPDSPPTISDYYYTGTILCENQESDHLSLVDGQQRITTVYLLNYLGYLLSRLRIKTIPPLTPKKYNFELISRFNCLIKWENRCFLKQNVSDDINSFLGDDDEDDDQKNHHTVTELSLPILVRIGHRSGQTKRELSTLWSNFNSRLKFSDLDIHALFRKAYEELDIVESNDEIKLIIPSGTKGNDYVKGVNQILRYLLLNVEDVSGNDEKIGRMIEYLEFYIAHLSMTCIISDNEDDSFNLFEVLNDRGQELTALDLVKNMIIERSKSQGPIPLFSERWKELKNIVSSLGSRGKADSNFVKYFIRSEGSKADNKQISYLRGKPTISRYQIFRGERNIDFFLRLQKSAQIINELHQNIKNDITSNSSPFDNYKQSCFQYASFMRMIGYDWGQQVIVGSNLLYLVVGRYAYPNNISINDHPTQNWTNSNSNPQSPDLKHFTRFLGDILLKVGLIGIINRQTSKALPDCSQEILQAIIEHCTQNGSNSDDPQLLRSLIEKVKAIAQKIINNNNRNIFIQRLESDFLADTNIKVNISKIILYILYSRCSTLTFTVPELEHFEPQTNATQGPPFYNKGDRMIVVNKLGNLFLIDRQINNSFSNLPVFEKLRLARDEYPNYGVFMTNLFRNVDFTLDPLVVSDLVHGDLPAIKKAITPTPLIDDSFEIDNTPTSYFFKIRTELIAELSAKYFFEDSSFLVNGNSYLAI